MNNYYLSKKYKSLNNLARILMIQGKYEEALKYMQAANIQSEEKFQQMQYKKEQMDEVQLLNQLCSQKIHKNMIKILASRKFQLAKILYKFCLTQDVVCLKIKHNDFKLENNQTDQDTTPTYKNNVTDKFKVDSLIELQETEENETYFSKMKRECFFSSKFYYKQMQQNYQDSSQIKYTKEIQSDMKIYLIQAIDLFYDSYNIFKTLALANDYLSQNEIFSIKLTAILSLIQVVKCQVLMKNRGSVIEQILEQIDSLLQEFIHQNIYFRDQQLFAVVLQKYRFIKAQYYEQNYNYRKAIKFYLHSLRVINRNETPKFYDTNYFLNTLQALRRIAGLIQIQFSEEQTYLLNEDILSLNIKNQANYQGNINIIIQIHFFKSLNNFEKPQIDEINFHEVFFKKNQTSKVKEH